MKIEEQVKRLQKGVTHIGVGTPARIRALAGNGMTQANSWCLRFYSNVSSNLIILVQMV